MDKITVRVLREHRRRQLAEEAAAGEAREDTGYVFTSLLGAALNPDYLTRRFRHLVTTSDSRRSGYTTCATVRRAWPTRPGPT